MTTFSRVLEKSIYSWLLKHINNNNILVNEQFGFCSNSSIELASYNVINEILQAVNNKNKVGGIFFDLEKAFDCVNHKILLSKLHFYGIKENMCKLIRFYLENRDQRVLLDEKLSQKNISLIVVPSNMLYHKD